MAYRMTKRTLDPITIDKFSVLTYNVSGNTKNEAEVTSVIRMKMISKILLDNLPDVVCLLDVSVANYQTLLKLLSNKYILFQVFIEEKNKYGEVLLCLRDTTAIPEGSQPYYYDLTIGNGRVVGTELYIKTLDLTANILLTKLQSPEQFVLLEQVAKPFKHVILMGDFPDKNIEHDYSDAWIKMGCPSYLRNYRRSRILWTKNSDIMPINLSLLGTAVIKKINLPPSSHLGLMAIFQKKE
jgi:hypothetical protein